METSFFAMKSIIPIFSIVILGISFRHFNIIDEDYISKTTNIIFNFAMPVMVFQKMLVIEAVPPGLIKAIVIFLAATVLLIISSWLITFRVKTSVRGSVVQGAFRCNLAIIGLAVVQNTMGETAAAYTMVLIAVTMPFYNLASIIILGYRSGQKGFKVITKVIGQLFRNPLIWGIFLGLTFNLLKISVIEVASTSLSYFSRITLPLALIGIGGSLQMKSLIHGRLYWSLSCFAKLLILPAITYALCSLFEIDPFIRGILVISAASPTAVSTFAMADVFGADSRLAGEIVSVSTIMSVLSLSMWILILT